MKVALITDLHFGARNDNQAIYKNQIRFFEDVFFPYLEKNKIRTIINLGDTFDRRKMINTDILYKTRRDVFPRMNENYDVHFLIGNHDCHHKSSNDVNSITECLSDFTNIKVYPETTEVTIEGLNIIFVPWINPSNYDATMEKLNKTKASVCMGHLELAGFEFHRGSICRHGLSSKIFRDRFNKTISGHFHKRTVTDDIVYLGTAYQTSWIDFGEEKGFHVLDTETLELQFIKNPHDLFVELCYPEILSDLTDKYVRIVVKEEETKTEQYQIYMNKINEMQPTKISTNITDIMETSTDVGEEGENIEVVDLLKFTKEYISGLENFSRKERLFEEFQNLYVESIS